MATDTIIVHSYDSYAAPRRHAQLASSKTLANQPGLCFSSLPGLSGAGRAGTLLRKLLVLKSVLPQPYAR